MADEIEPLRQRYILDIVDGVASIRQVEKEFKDLPSKSKPAIDQLQREFEKGFKSFSKVAKAEIDKIKAEIKALPEAAAKGPEQMAQAQAKVVRQIDALSRKARADIASIGRGQRLGIIDSKDAELQIAAIRMRIQRLVKEATEGLGTLGPRATRGLVRALQNVGEAGLKSGKDVAHGAHQAGQAMRQMSHDMKGMSHEMSLMQTVMMQIKFALISFALGFTFKTAVQGLVGLNAKLESTRVAFRQMLGSQAEANRMVAELEMFAAKTPFETEPLMDATRKLMAYGFAAKDIIPILTDVGDAASAMGDTTGEVAAGIIRAFGQMQSKGKALSEELNQQLAERGIPVWKMLADSMGKSTEEVQKLVERGLVPADKAIQAIREGMRRMYGGMMGVQAQTFSGLLSTLKDLSRFTVRDIGAGMFGAMKEDLADVTKRFEELRRSGGIADFTSKASYYLKELYETIKAVAKTLYEWGPAILTAAKWFAVLTVATKTYTITTAALRIVVGGAKDAIGLFSKMLSYLSIAFSIVRTRSLEAAAGIKAVDAISKKSVLGALLSIVTSLATAWLLFRRNTDQATEGVKILNEEVKNLTRSLKNAHGAQLFFEEQGARTRGYQLRDDALEARNRAGRLGAGTVRIRNTGFDSPGEETLTVSEYMRRYGNRSGLGKALDNVHVLSVKVAGMPEIKSADQAVAALTESVAEYRDKWTAAGQTIKAANSAAARGAKETGYVIEKLQAQIDANAAKMGALKEGDPELTRMRSINAGLQQQIELLEKREALDKGASDVDWGDLGGKSEEQLAKAQDRARELLRSIQDQVKRTAELAAADEEVRDVLSQIYALEDQIRDLRESAKEEGVAGTSVAKRMNEEADALVRQQDALRDRIMQFQQLRDAFEAIDGKRLNVEFVAELDAAGVDPDTLLDAVEAAVAKLESDLKAQTVDLGEQVAGGILSPEAFEKKEKELHLALREALANMLAAVRAQFPKIGDEAAKALIDKLSGMDLPPSAVDNFRDEIERMMRGMESRKARVEIDFMLGEIDEAGLVERMDEIGKEAKAALMDAWDKLPDSLKENAELLELLKKYLSDLGRETKKEVYDLERMANRLSQIGQALSDLSRLGQPFGGWSQDLAGVVGGLGDVLRSLGEIRAAQAKIKEQDLKGIDATAAMLVPQIGMAIGIISTVKGLADSLTARQKAEAQEREELAKRLRELRVAVIEQTKAYKDALEATLGGGRYAGDLTSEDITKARGFASGLRELLDSWRSRRNQMDPDGKIARGEAPDWVRDALYSVPEAEKTRLYELLAQLQQSGIKAFEGLADRFGTYLEEADGDFLKALDQLWKGVPGTGPRGDRIAAIDQVIDELAKKIGQKTLDLEGALEYLADIQRFLGIEGQDAFQKFVAFIDKLDFGPVLEEKLAALKQIDVSTDAGKEALTAWIREIKQAGLFDKIAPDELDNLLEALMGFTDAVKEARDALRDAAGEMAMASGFRDKLGLGANALRDVFTQALGAGAVSDQIGAMDLSTEAGRASLDAMIRELMQAILARTTDALGLSRDDAVELVDALQMLADAAEVAGKSLSDASARFSFGAEYADRLGLSKDALRDALLTGMESAGIGMTPEVLNELRGLKLTTEAGQAALDEMITRVLRSIYMQTTTADLGLSEEDAKALIDALEALKIDATKAEEPVSRSVQYVRTITEFQGAELVLLANEQVYRLREIAEGIDHLVRVMSAGQRGPHFDIDVPDDPMTPVLARMARVVPAIQAQAMPESSLTAGSAPVTVRNDIDISITVQKSMREAMPEIMREIEKQIVAKTRRGYGGYRS